MEEARLRRAHGLGLHLALGRDMLGRRKKTMAAFTLFTLPVAAMRSDPINPVTHPGGSFKVGLRFARIYVKKCAGLERLHWRPGHVASVNAQQAVFIVGDEEQIACHG